MPLVRISAFRSGFHNALDMQQSPLPARDDGMQYAAFLEKLLHRCNTSTDASETKQA